MSQNLVYAQQKIEKIVIRDITESYVSELRNINFCLTGNFLAHDKKGNPLTHSDMKRIIELGGSIVHDFIQEDTQILLAANPNEYSDRTMEALEKRITIIGELDFWDINKKLVDYKIIS